MHLIQVNHWNSHPLERPLDLISDAGRVNRATTATCDIDLGCPKDILGKSVLVPPAACVLFRTATSVAGRAIEHSPRGLGVLCEFMEDGSVPGEFFRTRIHRNPPTAQSDHRHLLAS